MKDTPKAAESGFALEKKKKKKKGPPGRGDKFKNFLVMGKGFGVVGCVVVGI